ncbi:bifunctional riboflavin kinase/FAD synthetase [Gloeocapsa sp. PCC 73106]|uniref:bifunctional riboflavin kinase/FAD synthetase n=1 Tax=Gloeocapsa sp. PCC 73106 TaxID=102232 RepID=UPI0002ABEB6D|nr:bifunctional riboflavin kinase/FAD synthetase [Gloeocapsa sp. PCC 73106]ELR99138.1 riboflavin kinase/FMN adenylyltransferase [Gloeocapsa sp. PCC 73106]
MLLNLEYFNSVWVTSLTNQILQPNAIALGNFDGLHQGHIEVLKPVIKTEKEKIYKTVVSFTPHPQEFFTGQQRKLLTPLAEKISYLEKLGLEQLILLPFDRELANLSPEDFLKELLVKKLAVRFISVGEDFRFGYQRSGDAKLLRAIAHTLGIEVEITNLKNQKDVRISSSEIRQALTLGEIEKANAMLGREYSILGKVIKGQQLGQKLGFPTANLEILPVKFLPKQGVYLVRVELINQPHSSHLGLMNIGYRPTVNGQNLTVETHLLDWSGDLYNQTLSVNLIKFLRPEQKFDSLEALKAQINADIQTARKLNLTISHE